MEKFHVYNYYILTSHYQLWNKIKKIFNTPIWTGIYKSKITPKSLKKKNKQIEDVEQIRTTYRLFLRAIGDLMCETSNNPVRFSLIKNKFLELASQEYDAFTKSKTFIKLSKEKKYETKKTLEMVKEKHLKKADKMMSEIRNITSLNSWLENLYPARFIKSYKEGYKLLILYAEGTDGEREYFCSEKNWKAYQRIINKEKKCMTQFENIVKEGYITSLDDELKSRRDTGVDYFRKLGPLDIHFQKRLMFRRPEVKKIKDKIENKNDISIQILCGNAGSGKTVIARNIGYELAQKHWKTYIVPIDNFIYNKKRKYINKGLDYLENISNNSFVLIEDFHKGSFNFSSLEWIIKNNFRIKFLLTTRDSYNVVLTREQIDIFERCERIDLNKVDFSALVDKIIRTYISNQKPEDKKKYDTLTSVSINEIKKLSDGNLWVLAYFLRAWNQRTGIDFVNLFNQVKIDIEELKNEFFIKYDLNDISEVLMVLAPLSKFEIGTPDSFINEKFGIIKLNTDTLRKLKEHDEIRFENGYWSIPHSTIATLYLETAMNHYPYLIENITNQLKNYNKKDEIDNYLLEFLILYFCNCPKNLGNLVYRIGIIEAGRIHRITAWDEKFQNYIDEIYRDKGYLLNKIFENDIAYTSVIINIKNSLDVEEIGLYLLGIALSSARKKIPEIINQLDFHIFAEKINKEKDGAKINRILASLLVDEKKIFSKKVIKNLNLDLLIEKMRKSQSFIAIYSICILLIIDDSLYAKLRNLLFECVLKLNLKEFNLVINMIDKVEHETNLESLEQDIHKIVNYEELLNKFEDKVINQDSIFCINFSLDYWLSNEKNISIFCKRVVSKINQGIDPFFYLEILMNIASHYIIDGRVCKQVALDIAAATDNTICKKSISIYPDTRDEFLLRIYRHTFEYKELEKVIPIIKKLQLEEYLSIKPESFLKNYSHSRDIKLDSILDHSDTYHYNELYLLLSTRNSGWRRFVSLKLVKSKD